MQGRLRALVFFAVVALQGCASPWATTYQPPGQGVALTVVAPQKTLTPLVVEVCANGSWEKAAVIGQGLVMVGQIIVADHIDIASRPNAIRLPDRAEFLVPAGQAVKFRVRSHPQYVSGGIVSPAVLASCTATAEFTSEAGAAYRAVWGRDPQSCAIGLTQATPGAQSGPERVVSLRDTDASCRRP
jgi:hypothetical protein